MKKLKLDSNFFLVVSLLILVLYVTKYTHVSNHNNWQNIVKDSTNAVVQIIAQKTEFNWQEPYKAPQVEQSLGSGFFINETDLLTNFHVVDQAKSLQICIQDLGKRAISAHIVGVCPESDLALLRISQKDSDDIKRSLGKFSYLELGDSDSLYPTEEVLALGYPLGQRYLKRTTGVIAGREYLNGIAYMHITAPLNPGNSGGPLVNKYGKVVGINTAIISNSQNIGYIVPICEVKNLLNDLYNTKLLRKPYLGIYCNTITDEHAKLINCQMSGLYVNDVVDNSSACKAGIKAGDILTKVDGYKVDQFGDVTTNWGYNSKISLKELLLRVPINRVIDIEVMRNGKLINIKCKMLDSASIYHVRKVYPDYEPEAVDHEIIGGLCIMQLRYNHLSCQNLPAHLYEFYSPEKQTKEVLVIVNILPGSYISKANCFTPWMLIDKINGKSVKNLKELRLQLQESLNTNFIEIQTVCKAKTIVSLDKVLEDEKRLAKDFKFDLTSTVTDLINKCEMKTIKFINSSIV